MKSFTREELEEHGYWAADEDHHQAWYSGWYGGPLCTCTRTLPDLPGRRWAYADCKNCYGGGTPPIPLEELK